MVQLQEIHGDLITANCVPKIFWKALPSIFDSLAVLLSIVILIISAVAIFSATTGFKGVVVVGGSMRPAIGLVVVIES